MNIFTVEQIANMTDGVLKDVGMDARTLRDKAREIVAEKQAPAKAAELERQNADLQAQIDELRAMAESGNGTVKRKRGRPPKHTADKAA